MKRRRTSPLFSAALLAFALPLGACSAAPDESPKSLPTTNPTVHLSDAIPLEQLETNDWQPNLTDKLEPPQANHTLYFGELDAYSDPDADPSTDTPDNAIPILARKIAGHWKAIPLVNNALRDAGWKYVAAGPAPHEIWAALDIVTNDTRSKFVLAHSTDGGDTFTFQAFTKPCKLATFFDFAMSQNGKGRATVNLDTDCGPHKAGLYHYETTDDGKTWSAAPRFESDVMQRSDPVPDEEQPDAPDQTPSKTMLR